MNCIRIACGGEMSKSVEKLTDDTINEGGVLSLLYFDIHGKSKEQIKNTMVDFIRKLTTEEGVVYAIGEIKDTIEEESGFTTSAEVKILTNDFMTLVNVGFRYGPIGVEIMKPNTVNLTLREAQDVILTAAQTSHEFSTYVVEKLMSDDEKKDLNKKLQRRAELGKSLVGGNNDAKPASEN
ncbi:MAG: hypothetical protein ABIG39_02305 [Candidatus Micrarchaeota archaeon]